MNKLHFWNLATILNIRSSIPLASSGDAQVSKLDEIEHFWYFYKIGAGVCVRYVVIFVTCQDILADIFNGNSLMVLDTSGIMSLSFNIAKKG